MSTRILVPGMRGATPEHWQEILAPRPGFVHLRVDRAPMDLAARVADLEDAVRAASAPVLLVAHSAGCLVAAHWASTSPSTDLVEAALFVTPPTLREELPAQYPRLAELQEAGWLPLPSAPLPLPVTIGLSDDDPLGRVDDVETLALTWGAEIARLGPVGHANPGSGHGRWPQIEELIDAIEREWEGEEPVRRAG